MSKIVKQTELYQLLTQRFPMTFPERFMSYKDALYAGKEHYWLGNPELYKPDAKDLKNLKRNRKAKLQKLLNALDALYDPAHRDLDLYEDLCEKFSEISNQEPPSFFHLYQATEALIANDPLKQPPENHWRLKITLEPYLLYRVANKIPVTFSNTKSIADTEIDEPSPGNETLDGAIAFLREIDPKINPHSKETVLTQIRKIKKEWETGSNS